MAVPTVTVAVIGLSGKETLKGDQGVGKSCICNRFIRGDYDYFIADHSSVLSKADFSGSPVINNDHWLYWGDRKLEYDDSSAVNVRVIEQTEFLDDETFEPLAGPSTSDSYARRAVRVKLESRDKLMYIQKEQLGLEVEFPQQVLPDGKCNVDCFILVFDSARIHRRSFQDQINGVTSLLVNATKTKKPVILAISKCDDADEEWRKAVQHLLNSKNIRGSALLMIETSAFEDVNVDELFIAAVNSVVKGKLRLRIQNYHDAVKQVSERRKAIRETFKSLLCGFLPISNWPMQRLSWTSLKSKLDIDRHPHYRAFISTYGEKAAQRLYDQHVNAAREHWMVERLKALLPQLTNVFLHVLDRTKVVTMTWADAKRVIETHALFDEYFQPLGLLGRQLDPLSPDALYDDQIIDRRIPAEILIREDARIAFESFRRAVEAEQRKERLEEEFECLLAETAQVTPGKSLQDVCVFLMGHGTYESLAPTQASMIYDRYQNELVHKAELEFAECLQEHVEHFLEMIVERSSSKGDGGRWLTTRGLAHLKDILQEDARYRHLSRLFELRDRMIHDFATFLSNPYIKRCPAKNKCIDANIFEALQYAFQRKQFSASENPRIVCISVHGDNAIVSQFVTDMNVLLRNDHYLSSCGPVLIKCETENDTSMEIDTRHVRTDVYLIDSEAAIERTKEHVGIAGSRTSMPGSLAPIFVLVCDPGHFDLLPALHQQGTQLAETTNGIFVGSGGSTSSETDSRWSKSTDCSSIFGRDQLLRVCDAVCSAQLERRQCDIRVQMSFHCGDPFATESVLNSIFCSSDAINPIVNQNLMSAGIVPVDVQLPSASSDCRVDVHFSSYHAWIAQRPSTCFHGHIIVYSAKRRSSLSHARAAVSRVLDAGCRSVSGKAILLVAIAAEQLNGESTNLLITEGAELAQSIGSTFTVIPFDPESPAKIPDFIHFFDQLLGMLPLYYPSTVERSTRENDGYATLSDFKELRVADDQRYSTYKSQSTTSGSSASRESTMSNQLKSVSRPSSLSSAPVITGKVVSPASSTGSSGSRPRRRAAPKTPVRLPPVLLPKDQKDAPLATPENIEIAPDYALVRDALTDDDHIYATVDFAPSPSNGQKSPSNKKDKAPLRKMFASTSRSYTASAESQKTPTTTCSTSAYMEHRPSLLTRTQPLSAARLLSSNTVAPSLSRSPFSRSARTQPLLYTPPQMQVPSTSTATKPIHQPLTTRSTTMDVINRETVVKARKQQQKEDRGILRQSMSVESMVDLLNGRKKKSTTKEFGGSRFVRKVATSFRFRKTANDRAEDDDSRLSVSGSASTESRSLPQSPFTERKNKKASVVEKTSAFPWKLPSRSPKRSPKVSSPEVQGVVLPTDTLTSLSESAEARDGIPYFLYRCVDFIEENGGLEMEGLYRVPGNQSQLLELEKNYRDKGVLDLSKMPVQVVATAVKNFFSCLPEPLIPHSVQAKVFECEDSDNVESLKSALQNLPTTNWVVLKYFTTHLHKVASSPATAMDLANLSKVWFPTFLRPSFDNFEEMSTGMTKLQRAMEAIFVHSNSIL